MGQPLQAHLQWEIPLGCRRDLGEKTLASEGAAVPNGWQLLFGEANSRRIMAPEERRVKQNCGICHISEHCEVTVGHPAHRF